jgi:hypothetical protein
MWNREADSAAGLQLNGKAFGRQAMKRTFKIVIGAILVLWGTWLALPRHGHSFEDLESSCRLGSGSLIRFFIGDGGATTAVWYSITAQTGASWSERELFYAYGEPVITGMRCQGETVSVSSASRTWLLDSNLLAQEASPTAYWRGKDNMISAREGLAPLDKLRIAIGICAFLVGTYAIMRNVRQRRAAEQGVAPDGRPRTAARR